MRIRSWVKLGIFGSMGSAAIVGLVLFVIYLVIDERLRTEAATHHIESKVFDLTLLTNGYLLHRDGSAQSQIREQYSSLGLLLGETTSSVIEQRRELDLLRRSYLAFGNSFDSLNSLREKRVVSTGGKSKLEFLERRLLSEMLAAAHAMASSAKTVGERSRDAVVSSSRQAIVLAAALLMAFAAAMGGTWLVTQRLVTKPVESLRAGIDVLSAGDLSHRLDASANNEIGDVARTVNMMAETLERTTVSLEELEKQVEQRTMELTAANRELDAFAYAVSHDLRAPLRAMDGFSKALTEDYGDKLDGDAHDYLDRISAAAQRMGQLIDDLLGLSRVVRREVQCRPVDLSKLAREIMDQLKANEPDRRVADDIAPGLVAETDKGLAGVVLSNVLGNAWKYSRDTADARIEFGVVEANGTPSFFVRDNGIGFDMAYAEKLFQPFQRLHSDRRFEGTGIGLATVARAVARLGGRVWAESDPGEGATVYFTL